MDTDLSEFRRGRSEENCRGDSWLRKSVKGDDSEGYGREQIKYEGKQRSKGKNTSRRREGKDSRERDSYSDKRRGEGYARDCEDEHERNRGQQKGRDGSTRKDRDRKKEKEKTRGETSVQDEPGKEIKERVSELKEGGGMKRKFEGASEILSRVVNKSRKLEEKVDLESQKARQRCRILAEICRKCQIPSHHNQVEDLNSSVRISSECYTPEEMLQFKKPKKKMSLRKREKLDFDGLEASRALRLEQTLSSVKEEDDTDFFAEDDEDLQKSLERARKLALKKQDELDAVARLAAAAAVSTQSADAQNSTSGNALDNKVVFTEMEEFVWGLRSEEDEALEASEEIKDETGGWTDEPFKTENKEEIVRDDNIYEAPAGKGLSGALKLLKDRGTLKETVEQPGRSTLVGSHGDDGPKEINLVRRDEFGREMTPKEAYRALCHKFHGKGPGKRKRERWIKQYQDELKLKQMTSSNVLPQSVDRMREALSQSKTPYIVLSGHVRPR
ncbi:SART-1 family protein DOT2-like [Silene latifolia]|uniref:SART-1 family protein DOT2-like n=1 Tax=Silene latifolia TaxID=37657 RepID=UPI003D77E139